MPTSNPVATAVTVPTTKGTNMRIMPWIRITRFMPSMLPTTRLAITKYSRLASFISRWTVPITLGWKTLK
ncbi:hypothetical protein D3C79_894510 [compost metagenome]